ncbi:hypothetical protein FQA39_LY18877 [Lamprigera yunnana]|nr:hypothetical protein FQA39_LY18877 [Lamprigera yunnana]
MGRRSSRIHDAHPPSFRRWPQRPAVGSQRGILFLSDDLYAKVAEHSARLPEGAWVFGSGYDQNKIGGHPDRLALDKVTGGRPAVLGHTSAHMSVVNTKALETAGYSDANLAESPVGRPKQIGRYPDGTMNGLLQEQAMALVGHLFKHCPELIVGGTRKRFEVVPANGLTSATVAALGHAGPWTGRYSRAAIATSINHDSPAVGASLAGRRREIARADHRVPPQRLHGCRARASETQHSTLVLDPFDAAQAELPRTNTRHRIEHVAVSSDEQVKRIVAGKHIPVPQGRFISELGDGFATALGPERLEHVYRMRSFVDAGVELPGSTDAPIVPVEPILSIHDMVNRRSLSGAPIGLSEALTPAQALRAYTYGSAYAVHRRKHKGTFSRGNVADLVVLSDDLLAVAPEKIRDIEVRANHGRRQFRYDRVEDLATGGGFRHSPRLWSGNPIGDMSCPKRTEITASVRGFQRQSSSPTPNL